MGVRKQSATMAKNRYRDKKYDRIEICVPKGMKETIGAAAEMSGQTRNNYILSAVIEKMSAKCP